MPVIVVIGKRDEQRARQAFNPLIAASILFLFAIGVFGCIREQGRDTQPPVSGAVTNYKTFSYDTANNLVKKVSYIPSGAGSSLAPVHEEISSYFDSVYDAAGRLLRQVRYDGPGRDAVWLTSDDDIDNYRATTYDGAGNISRETVFDGPGPDKTWITADDRVDYTTSFIYDSAGRLSKKITYDDSETDGAWFTSDDRIASFYKYDYDDKGRMARETRYYDPGPDGTWFTPDDLVSFYTTFNYDDSGNLISRIRYDHPGPGGEWFTKQDQAGAAVMFTYNNKKQTREVQYYGPGPDETWFTADDAVLRAVISTYDDAGRKIREEEVTGPGSDASWFTADDIASFFTTFDYNPNDTLARQTRYQSNSQGAQLDQSSSLSIGVYYYPGWSSSFNWWNDIQGLPGSLSPNVPWPDRVPLLGYYLEEQTPVAEKHIEWASRYGINFFVYDWYWDGGKPVQEAALQSYLRAANRDKLQFALLWANHFDVPNTMQQFDDMVSFWMNNYFDQPTYYTIDGKPVVYIFSNSFLDNNAQKFGETEKSLIARAQRAAQTAGYKGIYFILTTNSRPCDGLEEYILEEGYSAYTGWNYVEARDTSTIADYTSMVDTYLDFYNAAAETSKKLPYLLPASPGWDVRPWQGNSPSVYVRENSTPEKFEKMLIGARSFMDTQANGPKILMIEAWNEFGEGAYLEPTRKWDMLYLETLERVFNAASR